MEPSLATLGMLPCLDEGPVMSLEAGAFSSAGGGGGDGGGDPLGASSGPFVGVTAALGESSGRPRVLRASSSGGAFLRDLTVPCTGHDGTLSSPKAC